jgi:hypothetical protein
MVRGKGQHAKQLAVLHNPFTIEVSEVMSQTPKFTMMMMLLMMMMTSIEVSRIASQSANLVLVYHSRRRSAGAKSHTVNLGCGASSQSLHDRGQSSDSQSANLVLVYHPGGDRLVGRKALSPSSLARFSDCQPCAGLQGWKLRHRSIQDQDDSLWRVSKCRR